MPHPLKKEVLKMQKKKKKKKKKNTKIFNNPE